jgi:hypothetical protein
MIHPIRLSQTSNPTMTTEQQPDTYLSSNITLKSGLLKKKGVRSKTWRKRWFVLRPTKICYYLNDKEYELLAMVSYNSSLHSQINLADIHTVSKVDYKTRENVFCLVVKRINWLTQRPPLGHSTFVQNPTKI